MDAIPAKLTFRYQTTVPKKVRDALNLESGDKIIYEIMDDGVVILRKSCPLDIEYLEATNTTLSEWGVREDDQADGDL